MKIYFYDISRRYIGSRNLNDDEPIPPDATTIPADVSDGQEAYFDGEKWTVMQIPSDLVPE